jgi:2-hydroxy-6-oxonona-2,4-dienedioate hydrolase
MFLAMQYLLPHMAEAWLGGMEPVTKLPDMQASIQANPDNERILLRMDRQRFIDTLMQWLSAYIPREDQPVPGVDAADIRTVAVPTLVFRNGDGDIYHPAETSLEVHGLIPGAVLAEPPWGRDGWFKTKQQVAAGHGGFFTNWHLLAPAILDFALS